MTEKFSKSRAAKKLKFFEKYFENPKTEKKEPGEWCGEHVCEVSSKSWWNEVSKLGEHVCMSDDFFFTVLKQIVKKKKMYEHKIKFFLHVKIACSSILKKWSL